jgi:hypothetical protein
VYFNASGIGCSKQVEHFSFSVEGFHVVSFGVLRQHADFAAFLESHSFVYVPEDLPHLPK